MVSSFVIVTFLAIPKLALRVSGSYAFLSKKTPASSAMYCPPVNIEISCIIAFLLSPKEGALTTQIFKLLFSLFIINVAKISLSTSSQIMSNGFCCLYVNYK